MRVLMILFAAAALIWVFRNIGYEAEVAIWEAPLPKEYVIINQVNKHMDIDVDKKNITPSFGSAKWDTVHKNKEALKKEIIKALPLYANKPELFIVTNMLFRDEIMKYKEHAFLVTAHNSPDPKYIIDKLKEKDKILFSSMLSYLKPAGDKAKEICDTYSYGKCDPYVKVLVDLGRVYNIQQKFDHAIPYLETAIMHLDCFENTKVISPEQESHTALGLAYVGVKQFDAAINELDASKPVSMTFSVQMSGWNPELAIALKKAGYTEAAKAYWKAEVAFWEKEIEENIENKHLLKIKKKMREKAKIFLSDLAK